MMRLLPAHILALFCYLVALYYLLAFVMGFATLGDYRFRWTMSPEAYGFGLIFMMFMGPIALAGLAIYYALFRASIRATLALGIASAVIFVLVLGEVFGGNGGSMMLTWAGITAGFVHHTVFFFARGATNLLARA
jgi:hypothetical protein